MGKQLHFFNNYSSEDNFVAAIKLRNKNELSKIPDKIGYYKWWAKKEDFNYICERLYVNYDDIKDDVEVKNNYYGLYVGIAANESVRARINWHVNDIHSKSRVENGTLSTFRQSISSIVVENQYDKDSTNEFIDKLNVEYFTLEYPIKSVEAKEELHNIERNLLINNLYLLNIQENKHPKSKPIKKRLKYLRKISKEI
ncbi:MAG: hypothetical protein E7Z84_08990 [Methanosphaera stadtmanae]|nr:hypothetical protein [Methanosphaera stadtmanae]